MKLLFRAGVMALCAAAAFAQADQKREYNAHVQKALGLTQGAVVADIGTGDSPEHPVHMSQAVGDSGSIICVDIKPEKLEALSRKLEEKGIRNFRTQLGKPDDPMLPAHSVDAVLVSYAYHEMPEHEAMLGRIRAALRSGGRLVVIESISQKNRELPRERQIGEHELSPEILESELKAAGFRSLNGVETLLENGGVLRYLIAAEAER